MIIDLEYIKEYMTLPKDVKKIAEDFSLQVAEVEEIVEKDNKSYLIIDNKSLTHRSDLWSYWGVLREFACLYDQEYLEAERKIRNSLKGVNVKINSAYCKDYALMKVTVNSLNQKRLEKIRKFLSYHDIESKNDLEDILTYATLISGMPLQAYPFSKEINLEIMSGVIKNSEFTDKLVVKSKNKMLALAGVQSVESDESSEFLIEFANYEASYIRKTAQDLKIRNQNTMRFEKKIDSHLINKSASFLKDLFLDLGAKDISFKTYKSQKRNEKYIEVDFAKVKFLLANAIDDKKIKSILSDLGFMWKKNKVLVPSYRLDISILEDLVEELGRMISYNSIQEQAPKLELQSVQKNQLRKLEDFFIIKGGNQVLTYPIVPKSLMTKYNYPVGPVLLNPQSSKQESMRTSLYPQHLELLKRLKKKTFVFEIGRTYNPETQVVSFAFYDYSLEDVLNLFKDMSNYLGFKIQHQEITHDLAKQAYGNNDFECLEINDKYLKKNNFNRSVIVAKIDTKDLFK